MSARTTRYKESSRNANVNPSKLQKFNRAFSLTGAHFKLTKKELELARDAAMEDYAHACDCYMAIARSL